MNKQIHKLISLLLAIVMSVSVFTAVQFSASAAETDDYEMFQTTSDGRFQYSVKNSEKGKYASIGVYYLDEEEVEIPSSIGGIPVKEIDNSAFAEKQMNSVVIPDSVEIIGNNAFYSCTELSDIKFSANVYYVGDYAFTETKWYDDLPDGQVIIGACLYSLKGGAPETLVINDNVKTVTEYIAFRDETVKKIVFPESIELIGNFAFYECENLSEVALPDKYITLDVDAFEGTPYMFGLFRTNGAVCLAGNVLGLGYDTSEYSVINIPEGINRICERAFMESTLSEVNIPNSVKRIETSAFYNMEGVKKIHVPESVDYLGMEVFGKCVDLEEITLPDVVSEDSEIGAWGFSGCSSLKSVKLPEGIKNLRNTFAVCKKLSSVELPQSLESISTSTFYNCIGLESLNITKNVKSIIAVSALRGCCSLKNITVDGSNEYFSAENNILYNKDKTKIVFYGSVKTDESFKLPDSVKVVGDAAFAENKSLKRADLNNAEIINSQAFNGTGLRSINIPKSVTEIQYDTFADCRSLSYVDIPEGVERIQWGAFMDCDSLNGITLPESVSSIDELSLGYKSETELEEIHDDFYEYDYYVTKNKKHEGFTIFGAAHSAAEDYAVENDFDFVDVSDSNNVKTDSSSKITVAGKTDDGTLKVEKTGVGNADIKLVDAEAYSLSIQKSDGTSGKLKSLAEVRIPSRSSNPAVYRIDDGRLVDMKAGYADGCAVFYTDKLGTFAVGEKKQLLTGDVNGDKIVNISDATLIQKHIAQLVKLEGDLLAAADANGDGLVTIDDATAVQKYVAQIIHELG